MLLCLLIHLTPFPLLKGDVSTVTTEAVPLYLIPDNSKTVHHGTTFTGVLVAQTATLVEQDQPQSPWQVVEVATPQPVHGMIFMKTM